MYTKDEAAAIRHKFWICFGRYMAPVPSAASEKINWINYKTGIKGIFFKMDADKESAIVAIEISLRNKMLQHQYFDLYVNFANQLKRENENEWTFEKFDFTGGINELTKIYVQLNKVNIYNENDWPAIISFLKKNIIALDSFWNEYKPAFEIL